MSQQLEFRLFGQFEVRRDGVIISREEWRRRKNQIVLKILLNDRGQVFTQDQLIDAVFPHLDPARGAANLRGRISELRLILEPNLQNATDSRYILTVGRGGYSFSKAAACWIDTEAFSNSLKAAQAAEAAGRWSEALASYEQATDLYRGDYLAEDLYEEWTLSARERWRQLYLDALSHLAECGARLGQYPRAIESCQKIIQLSPLHEGAYRQLMLYHYLTGERSAAIQVYQSCARVLQEELATEPAKETQQLHEQILTNQVASASYPALERPNVLSAFKGVSLFSELQEAEMVELWKQCEFRQFAAGEYILREGDFSAAELFLILEGQVEIRRGGRAVAKRGKGRTIGEMSLLTGNPRSADVVALAETRCLTLTREHFRQLVCAHPQVGLRIMADLALRLEASTEALDHSVERRQDP